jgi:hypothetical protein
MLHPLGIFEDVTDTALERFPSWSDTLLRLRISTRVFWLGLLLGFILGLTIGLSALPAR